MGSFAAGLRRWVLPTAVCASLGAHVAAGDSRVCDAAAGAECSGSGGQQESLGEVDLKFKLEGEELTCRYVVTVLEAFESDSESNPALLEAGIEGRVESFDEDGDATIDFDGIEKSQWVVKDNFDKLEGMPPVPPAESDEESGEEIAGDEGAAEKTCESETVTADTLEVTVPLYALPLDMEVPGPAPQDAWAWTVRGSPRVAFAAETLQQQLAFTRRAMADDDAFDELSGLHYLVETATNEIKYDDFEGAKYDALVRIELAMQRFVEVMAAEVAAPMLGCPLARLHCAKFNWYARFVQESLFGEVHNDGLLNTSELEYNDAFGASMDDYVNLWTLISEAPFDQPIILLDPSRIQLSNAYVWPPTDNKLLPNDSSRPEDATAGVLAYTAKRLRRGDTIVWRTAQVPHGAGKARGDDWKNPGGDSRQSFDMRCHCARIAKRLRRTKNGEICRQTWYHEEVLQHGCSNPDNDEGGPWCVIEREYRGGSADYGDGDKLRWDTCNEDEPIGAVYD